MPKIRYYTVEPANDGDGFWVVAHGEYDRGSVLEGEDYRGLCQHYETANDALEDYPGAKVLDHSTKNPFAGNPLPSTAPDWFDPLDAGERWDYDY